MLRPIRSLLRRLLRRGSRTTSAERLERDRRDTQRLLARLIQPGSNCIDIGAHDGDFLVQFAALAPQGSHLAVEPLPERAERLRERFPGVEVVACALSDRTDRATFFRALGAEAWSGLRVQPYGKTGVRPEPFEVELRRLDDLVPPDRQVDFIKIDVEGAELEVLRGAEGVIRRSRPAIYFEHAAIHADPYGTRPEQIRDLLDGFGLRVYTISGIGPLSAERMAAICRDSGASGYDRDAHTNFLALAGDYPSAG